MFLNNMLRKFFSYVIHAGTRSDSDLNNAKRVSYLNSTLFFGLLIFIGNTIYEFTLSIPYTVAIDICFIACILICYLINIKGNYNLARNFIIVSLNVLLVCGNYAEGMQAGNYLNFIPLIFLFSILGKINDNLYEIIILFIFTIACILCSFIFFPGESTLQKIPAPVLKAMFLENFILSIAITFILSLLNFNVTRIRELELTQAKDEAEQSAKVKLQFLSNVSHELRTPLNGILGTSNLLQEEPHNNIQKEHFKLLHFSSTQMLNLINDLLDFSKIDADKLQFDNHSFNVETFIKNIYASFAYQFESKGLFLKLDTDDDLDFNIISDDIRLSQVLNNLLANALKFTETGGVTLKINLQKVSAKNVTIGFAIKDTGIGIATDKLSSIFESFTQADLNTNRKFGGTGLGLSISKNIVQQFNSDLKLTSELNKGSIFSFEIIVEKDLKTPEIILEKQEVITKDLRGLNILIAEDNKINMAIARKFLLKWNANITEAVNGKEAIELAKKNKYDVLLLDLEMPEVDGYTALEQIRNIYPHTPAIAFTASAFENIESYLLQKGFNDYILKPFDPLDLNDKLSNYLKQKVS
jgi:signal transduction histidine kinase/ActR/RegA family two-component response regulator